MRIAVLTSLYPSPPRPYEGIFAERRWRGMRARGHQVSVVRPVPLAPWLLVRAERAEHRRMPRREEREGVAVARPRYLHLPGSHLANAGRFARCGVASLLALAEGRQPEVVVADYAWPAAAAAPRLVELGYPCVVSGRGGDVLGSASDPERRRALAAWLSAAGHWCAVSRHLVEAMDEIAGRPGHGRLVENGIDLERFQPVPRAAARHRLGLPEEGALILVVGHLIERKDPVLAVRAFSAASLPGSRLVFIGRGPLAGQIEAESRALGLGDRVLLAGEKAPPELADWYAAMDCLLLCSRSEGRPNVVLEALASGRPVLATSSPGSAELLAGLPALCAETRDAAELGARLAGLVAAPPSAEELRRVAAGLSWEAGLAQLEGSLEEAIAARRAP